MALACLDCPPSRTRTLLAATAGLGFLSIFQTGKPPVCRHTYQHNLLMGRAPPFSVRWPAGSGDCSQHAAVIRSLVSRARGPCAGHIFISWGSPLRESRDVSRTGCLSSRTPFPEQVQAVGDAWQFVACLMGWGDSGAAAIARTWEHAEIHQWISVGQGHSDESHIAIPKTQFGGVASLTQALKALGRRPRNAGRKLDIGLSPFRGNVSALMDLSPAEAKRAIRDHGSCGLYRRCNGAAIASLTLTRDIDCRRGAVAHRAAECQRRWRGRGGQDRGQ